MLFPWLNHPDARVTTWIGLAKNVGKTTAMNAGLDQLARDGLPVGVLSSGVDGERNDAFSGAAKPPIHLVEGSLLATAEQALARSEAGLTLLEATGVRTPMGEVFIAQVERPGHVLLAGLRRRSELLRVRDRLHALGAHHIFIDGAFDRRASADPDLADRVVLATGAVVAPTLDAVVAATVDAVQRLTCATPSAADAPLAQAALDGVVLVCAGDTARRVPGLRGVSAPDLLARHAADVRAHAAAPLRLSVPGLVSDGVLRALLPFAEPGAVLVARDPTRLHASRALLDRWLARGAEVRVARPTHLASLTVNPHAPGASHDPAHTLADALHAALPHVPVLDVLRGTILGPSPSEAPCRS